MASAVATAAAGIGLLLLGACGRSARAPGVPDVELAGTWYWGDPHSHSAWSYDGCEEPDSACAAGSEGPGGRFLAEAEANDLDFAALTDHAEADLYWPDGLDGASYGVWVGQAAVLRGGDGAVLPVLGFEWTGYADSEDAGHLRGGHRTVLLDDPFACDDYRVPGRFLDGGLAGPELGRAVYQQVAGDRVTDSVAALWDALDAAREGCPSARWVTFAHHTAHRFPQQTDWYLEENAPERETVVEIYSEHGSSECDDLEADGCAWGVADPSTFYADGSVWTALLLGYRLGFVAATDSHDCRPGSLADGPGPVGQWTDEDGDGEPDTLLRHATPGGLTGVLVQGDLTTAALLDALEARRTVATSGPRPQLGALGLGADGREYLPGDLVPRRALPLQVRARVPVSGEYDRVVIERLAPIGGRVQVVASAEAPGFQDTWSSPLGEEASWTYLRVRFLRDPSATADSADTGFSGSDSAGGEDRIWVSPWFVEGDPECGCDARAGRPRRGTVRVSLLPLLAVLGTGLRRRRSR